MSVSTLAACLVSIFLCSSFIEGYPQYRDEIPNGYNVSNPCMPGSIWNGVGHKNPAGGGDRNPFGLDFAANGHTWNPSLCNKDSDGDGISNGEELGDPNCTWTKGSVPSRTTAITHPGICEPLDSSHCQMMNSWMPCGNQSSFSCPSFQETDTKTMDLLFPRTAVPAQETTYICLGFQLPSDMKYHILGIKPKLNNTKFLHHMLLYGCNQPLTAQQLSTPAECQMAVQGCLSLLQAWTVGLQGFCIPDDAGVAIGQGAVQFVILQLHWNNPQQLAGEYDSSGMTVYYTPKLRSKETLFIFTGQFYLEIPPQQQEVVQVGSCSKACTNTLNGTTLQVIASSLHMHLMGRSGSIVIHHKDGSQDVLTDEPTFDYNSPKVTSYMPPFNISAGDEVTVTCRYNSMSKNSTTYWGEATSAEMCFGFLMIVPGLDQYGTCGQYKDTVEVCRASDEVTYKECPVHNRIIVANSITNMKRTQMFLQRSNDFYFPFAYLLL